MRRHPTPHFRSTRPCWCIACDRDQVVKRDLDLTSATELRQNEKARLMYR